MVSRNSALLLAVCAIAPAFVVSLGCSSNAAHRLEVESVEASNKTTDRLERLGIALMHYAKGNGNKLPDMSSIDVMGNTIYSTLPAGSDDIFLDAQNGETFVPNRALSEIDLAKLPDRANTAMVYQARSYDGQTRIVCFADGRVRWINESDWTSIKTASKIR